MQNKNESIFLTLRTVSYLGNKFLNYSLAFFILEKTGKTLDLAILFAMGVLPEILFNFIGGITGDIFNKKYINISCDFLRAFILLFFIIFVELTNTNFIYSISVLKLILSLVGIFVAPAIDGIIPEIISKENLLKFNTKYTIYLDGVDIISPLLAGYLYINFGLYVILIIDLISFIISGILFSFIKLKKSIIDFKIKNENQSFFITKDIFYLTIENFLVSIAIYPILDIYFIHYFTETLNFSDLKYGQYQSFLFFISVLVTILIMKKIEIINKNKIYFFLSCILFLLSFFKVNIIIYSLFFIILDNIGKILKIKFETKLQHISPLNNFAKISSVYWTFTILGMMLGNFLLSSFIDKNLNSNYYIFLSIFLFLIAFLFRKTT
ncbi:MFS transporter [uncultured Cetobacterium sp.]|uniref:MFS transporter n=1 Tax=uncultured Cetobacterium sp. TaxID=527638 RepID=UPI00262B9991|nr:MFS transporter [uncultured Cetobacterium sp.]